MAAGSAAVSELLMCARDLHIYATMHVHVYHSPSSSSVRQEIAPAVLRELRPERPARLRPIRQLFQTGVIYFRGSPGCGCGHFCWNRSSCRRPAFRVTRRIYRARRCVVTRKLQRFGPLPIVGAACLRRLPLAGVFQLRSTCLFRLQAAHLLESARLFRLQNALCRARVSSCAAGRGRRPPRIQPERPRSPATLPSALWNRLAVLRLGHRSLARNTMAGTGLPRLLRHRR